MAQVVFILGAGASVHAGVPVMDSFYNQAFGLKKSHLLGKSDEEHFEKIISVYESLRRLYSHFKLKPKLSNIETIYGLIEMGNLIKIFPQMRNEQEISGLKTSINKFIIKTLELKTKFALSQNNKEVISPIAYEDLSKIIVNMEANSPSVSSCILTFNYDIALDFILQRWYGSSNINYCLDRDVNKRGYKLIKLHGSINWGICRNKKCKKINPASTVEKGSTRIIKQDNREFWYHNEISLYLKKLKCSYCNGELSDLPLIVPPTWNKTEYHVHLANVWWHAAKELSAAEIIIIVGYSLPESDLFFKYLLSLGGIDLMGLTDFIVLDKSLDVINKYYDLLGDEIRDDKFNLNNTIKPSEFRPALKHIHDVLKNKYGIP